VTQDDVSLPDRDSLETEAGDIAWVELQRFFAAGRVIAVSVDLDLIEVALACAEDDVARFDVWTRAGRVGPVTDAQAREWLNANALMRAVVAKPWVLVQPRLVIQAGHA
jgi:hypothetical protein